MNYGTIAVVLGIIFSIMGNYLSTAQKHNRLNCPQKFEHDIGQLGPIMQQPRKPSGAQVQCL